MSNIPLARKQLITLTRELNVIAVKLRAVETLMHREMLQKRGERHSVRLTPRLEHKIVKFKLANPKMLNREIGDIFSVDGGRVSEAYRRYVRARKVGTHVSTIETARENGHAKF